MTDWANVVPLNSSKAVRERPAVLFTVRHSSWSAREWQPVGREPLQRLFFSICLFVWLVVFAEGTGWGLCFNEQFGSADSSSLFLQCRTSSCGSEADLKAKRSRDHSENMQRLCEKSSSSFHNVDANPSDITTPSLWILFLTWVKTLPSC